MRFFLIISVWAEARILHGLKTDMPDVTKILITQRVASIHDADKILVMDKGRVSGFGTHEDLIKTNGIYRDLCGVSYCIGDWGYRTLENHCNKNPLDVRSFVLDIRKGKTDSLKDRFMALFARLPYPDDEKVVEQNFQNVIYIVFMLLGQYTFTEIHSAKGRADCIAETDDYIYIFEFKRDKSAGEALQQIEDMGYAKPYAADQRTLLKIGVSFDSKERSISGWEVRSRQDLS